MYAFEREVREVQELVQRRDTFPSGVALLIPLAVAVAVMLLPTCVYYFVFVSTALAVLFTLVDSGIDVCMYVCTSIIRR